MKRKSIHEIDFCSDQHREREVAVHKNRMPIVRCVCGSEILVVPDSKAMNRAIKNHLAEHKRADYGLVPDLLEAFLTEQVLIAAGKMDLQNAS
jgi:hypothetical protein